MVVDDTLFHRYGTHTHGVFWQHDGSAKGRDGIGRGNCFGVVGLTVTVPFLTRPVCLPVHHPPAGQRRPARPATGADRAARTSGVEGRKAGRLRRPHHSPRRYAIALVSTDTDAPVETIISRYADRWSVEQTIKDATVLLGAGHAANRLRRAVERTAPFAMLGLTILVLWYGGHGTAEPDLAAARARAPWNRRKTHVSVDDMRIAFRWARITAISPGRDTRDYYPDRPVTSTNAAA